MQMGIDKVKIPDDADVVAIAAGESHAVVCKDDGSVEDVKS